MMLCSLRRVVGCALVLALAAVAPAAAQQQPVHIRSSGPLTDIALGPTLDCQVTVGGKGMYWHPDEQLGECGTFLSVPGQLWGPVGSDRVVERLPFQPVSQSPVSGTGTQADPYLVTTVVKLGPRAGRFAGVQVRESVRYVTGQNWYFGDVRVTNHGSRDLSLYLYHAADCHLPDGGDFGVSYGYARTAPFGITGVGCSEHPDNRPNGERQALLPTTLGDQGYSYMQGFYQSVWDRVSAGFDLPNTVSENVQWDTAMAVAWLYDGLPVGAPVDFNYVASFAMPPVVPPIEPPVEPTPPTEPGPKPPEPGPQPPGPEDPANVAIRDPVFVPPTSGSADVIARCLTRPRGHCFIEAARGLQRRAAVVRRGQLARLAFSLSPTQRRQLRDSCTTEMTVRVAVYQPNGNRARVARRTISVFCERLRGRCAAASSSATVPWPLAFPPAVLASRQRPPSARMAC